MRYQERIYIQNENSGVRNKDILNVNGSSDICIFESPSFNLSGATKIDCGSANTGTTGVYIISGATTIPIVFDFTANTNTFTATNATFKYEVYKYNPDNGVFMVPPIIKSDVIEYSTFSATSSITTTIAVSGLSLDGEYIVKGYYEFDACTDFLNRLGKKVDTLTYLNGSLYRIYEPLTDFYFIAFNEAATPIFNGGDSGTLANGSLSQQVILPPPKVNTVLLTDNFVGDIIVTLNGLVLAKGLDYTLNGNLMLLSGYTALNDIITVVYTKTGANNLSADVIDVPNNIPSGPTGSQGTNKVYYNTTTGKYEVYTNNNPVIGSNIIVMINGVTLANGIDYYQSTTDTTRIILVGNLINSDIVTIVYFPISQVINGIYTNTPTIGWLVQDAPANTNGEFILEVSTGKTFATLYSTGSTEYVANQSFYNLSFTASGTVGTYLYYRVKNNKKYATLCGRVIDSVAYSEVVPIIIQTNSINSY